MRPENFSFLFSLKWKILFSVNQLFFHFKKMQLCLAKWKILGTLPPCFSGCCSQVSSFPVCTITDLRRAPCVKTQCSGQTDLLLIFPSCFFIYFVTGYRENRGCFVSFFYTGVWGSVHWLISMNYISLYWGLAFQLIKSVLSGLVSCFIFMERFPLTLSYEC